MKQFTWTLLEDKYNKAIEKKAHIEKEVKELEQDYKELKEMLDYINEVERSKSNCSEIPDSSN